MADAKKDTDPEGGKAAEGEAPKMSKTPIVFGGGTLALVGLGYILSLMAVPTKESHRPELEGPFVAALSKRDLQVPLGGENSKRYLVMRLQVEYFAYDESYVAGRLGAAVGNAGGGEHGDAPVEDPDYTAQLKNALLKFGSSEMREQVSDPLVIDGFLEDVRTIVDPILFPIYVGDAHTPHDCDKESGVQVGDSSSESSFRGLLHEHELAIDGTRKRIRLDDGPWVEYEGRERDLMVRSKQGERVYVNLTQLKPDLSFRVPIGVPGRVRAIYRRAAIW